MATKHKKTTNPKSPTTKTALKHSSKATAGIIGATLLLGGAGGYGIGTVTSQNAQEYTPNYTVTTEELKVAKNTLKTLNTRDLNASIPDYPGSKIANWTTQESCDTRNSLLAEALINAETSEGCKVISGTLFDYYTGTIVQFNNKVNGGGVDIDHIVAKENAWNSGGHSWNEDQWRVFANDNEVLIPTSSNINRSKGSKDASEWLPPNEEYHCRYVIQQINIKKTYKLSITEPEKDVMQEVLDKNCQSSR